VAVPQDKLILEGMQFYGYHGALPEERQLGQRFLVDLEMFCDLQSPGISDMLEEAVDYAGVFELVKGIVEKERYRLIEALAERIASAVLENFPVEGVLVRVKKPEAPLPGILSYAGVEIRRGRCFRDE